jgi:hypothetical protein
MLKGRRLCGIDAACGRPGEEVGRLVIANLTRNDDAGENRIGFSNDGGAESWVLLREVLCRLCRNEQRRLGYHLWVIKPITWLDPDGCKDSDDWFSISTPTPAGDGDAVWFNDG